MKTYRCCRMANIWGDVWYTIEKQWMLGIWTTYTSFRSREEMERVASKLEDFGNIVIRITFSAMKKVQKACAVIGGTALLMGAGIVTGNPVVILGWLAVSASLLYAGKAFVFQQNR